MPREPKANNSNCGLNCLEELMSRDETGYVNKILAKKEGLVLQSNLKMRFLFSAGCICIGCGGEKIISFD